MSSKKAIDLVVYGATGYTGKLACEYLAQKETSFHQSFQWAIAGRDSTKLQNVKDSLVSKYPHLDSLEIVVADSGNSEAVDAMTARSKALVTFAGPYSKYGTGIVESCVKNSTHYADLTGELFWVRDMIAQFEQQAQNNKVKLIPTCGFDSVPSDWSAKSVADLFRKELNEDTKKVKNIMWDGKGGFSGGTIASGFAMTEPANIKKTVASLKDLQSLNPEDKKNGLDKPDLRGVIWDKDLNTYLSPFIMAPCNTRVVRRSNALNNYGPEFTYEEALKCNTYLGAQSLSWGTSMAEFFLFSSYLRPIVKRAVPQPGQGPNEKTLDEGFALFKFFGESATSGTKASGHIKITGDPGYLVTARMLVEAGIDMALESETVGRYGFQTPASGLSDKYFANMLQNGFEVEVSLDSKSTEGQSASA